MITLDIPPGDFRAFIFDCDGTLADTMPLHHQAYLDILRPMGFDFPEELFYSLGGIPAAGVLEVLNERFGWTIPVAATAERKEARFAELIPLVKPITPVVDFMRGVAGRFPVAVASGGMKSLVLATLGALGIHEYFGAVVTYEDVVHPKPAPDTYLEAARRLGRRTGSLPRVRGHAAGDRSGHRRRDAKRAGRQRAGDRTRHLNKNVF